MECEISQPWFNWIEDGRKTVEGRINRGKWRNALPGKYLYATEPQSKEILILKIVDRREYPSFEKYIENERSRAAPGYTKQEALTEYLSFYENEQDPRPDLTYGVVALEIFVI